MSSLSGKVARTPGFGVPGPSYALGYYNSWSSEAMVMRLAREEGLFAGTSTGCDVIVALRLAEQLGSDASIVTVMCDTGMKYLKTFGKQKAESRK
jgi:cysteine synthase